MWVVVYRTDAGEGPGSEKNIRNRLWVRRDGTVVRQEVLLGDHSLLFKRMSEKDAAALRDEHKEFQRQQPRSATMIEFDLVVRRYGRTVAVNGLTLTIPRGELFALLGPNGAGKTTAIRMLVGLLQPDSGHVRVCGVDCSRKPREASSHLGYVPDEQYLYEKLSGRELLEFAARDARSGPGHDPRSHRPRDGALRAGRASSTTSRKPTRTACGSGWCSPSPCCTTRRCLVVDEPMVGLDPRSARVVKDLLRAEAAAGKTVLMSTHTLAVAEEIADRIGILNRGQLDFLGTLAELRQELSAPQQALEHLFLELTNGHASSTGGTCPMSTEELRLMTTAAAAVPVPACLRRKPNREDSCVWSGGSCGRSSPRDLPPPACAMRW